MSKLQLVAGLAVLLVVSLIGAALGAISIGATGLLIAGGLKFLGFVGLGTAKAIFIAIASVGAVVGAVFAAFWTLAMGATMG